MNSVVSAVRIALAVTATLVAGVSQGQPLKVQAITQVAPNLPQYTRVDQPLLRDGLAKSTHGKVEVALASWPERNVSGPEVLRLVRSGQVDIAAAPLITVSGDVPLLDGLDLAGMNTDVHQARKVAEAMATVVNKEFERLGIRMVAHYAYSAQLLYCRQPISSLKDVKGLKVRTIGPSSADLMKALGAQAVSMALGEIYTALERGTVDCAVTGAGPGNGLKLPEVTTHLYTLPLAWSTAGYFVNLAWWTKLDPALRSQFEKTFAQLQDAQWALVSEASDDGVACNVGRAANCRMHSLARKPMVEVKAQPDVAATLRSDLVQAVLPGWVKRCGDRCAAIYNEVIAPITGLKYAGAR